MIDHNRDEKEHPEVERVPPKPGTRDAPPGGPPPPAPPSPPPSPPKVDE